jgi:hypothetical protein
VHNRKIEKLGSDLIVEVYAHNGKEFVHRPGGGEPVAEKHVQIPWFHFSQNCRLRSGFLWQPSVHFRSPAPSMSGLKERLQIVNHQQSKGDVAFLSTLGLRPSRFFASK